MTSISKTVKRAGRSVRRAGRKTRKAIRRDFKRSAVGQKLDPDLPELEELPILPLPDEEEVRKDARKRRARASSTGRESTILTGTLGA